MLYTHHWQLAAYWTSWLDVAVGARFYGYLLKRARCIRTSASLYSIAGVYGLLHANICLILILRPIELIQQATRMHIDQVMALWPQYVQYNIVQAEGLACMLAFVFLRPIKAMIMTLPQFTYKQVGSVIPLGRPET